MNHREIDSRWQKYWAENKTYAAEDNSAKEKFYVLDMFPYPSGAGLHVGHPLGYIASDIYARYKRLQGYNVLHPMGYDSFGLPAEQYAIQTGQHPAVTTEENIARYREQLDSIGFSFDWDREVRTSDPAYYKWTQWIFKQLFNSWYNNDSDKAEPITSLEDKFAANGSTNVNATTGNTQEFTAEDWNSWDESAKQKMLLNYRLAYLADSWVNWCPALGTVLANDEVKDGVSERGGHPVEQKLMRQWSLRITAYAERLLEGLERVDFSESLKEQQRNWIGKSRGASVRFKVEGHKEEIEVFTTRPDTIYGVSFMVLAPEHELVNTITTDEFRNGVESYQSQAAAKSERDRQSDVKNITGQFTGAYAIHPFSGEKVQIWIGDYVLASYGTGAVMAVPAGDQRDWEFATHFNIPIPNIFEGVDISEGAYAEKDAVLANSDFLNGLPANEGIKKAIQKIEEMGIGSGKTNYRLRDAIFSRQRYWGEPFPVYYKDEIPYLLSDEEQVTLPPVDKYLPTEDGEPPLARANKEDWNIFRGDRMEYNTMPGWAGSSWYFLRYMDPHNETEFASKKKLEYWNQVDLYVGGAEHAVGHLLYSRFWTKFLHDRGYISFDEPFKKLINQGMIGGSIEFLLLKKEKTNGHHHFVCRDIAKKNGFDVARIPVRIDIVEDYGTDNSFMKIAGLDEFRKWRPDYEHAIFECSQGIYHNGEFKGRSAENKDSWIVTKTESGKMSKRYFNTVDPVDICEQYGADTLRMYEMFLGPLTDSKPWNTQGINGVHNFLKKFWRLFHDEDTFRVNPGEPTKEELKVLHGTIKKVQDDLDRYSFNTVVSNFMIATNELSSLNCSNATVLKEMLILLSPYAPHIAEELWHKMGLDGSVTQQQFPKLDESFLVEDAFEYPVSFNGKVRFKLELPTSLSKEEIEAEVMAFEKTPGYLDGKTPKKIIVVPKRIVNIVV